MEGKVLVAKEEGEQISELPLEEDGSLLFSTLVKFFPQARGLRYYTEIDTIRGVKLSNGKFHPPHQKWGSTVFYCVSLDEFNSNPTNTESAATSEEISVPSADVRNESEEIDVKVEFEEEEEEEEETPAVPPNNVMLLDFGGVKNEEISPNDNTRRVKFRTMSNKRPHKCDICGNCFTQQSHMQRHRRIHTGEKPFSCEACGEKFSRSDKLKLHTYKCKAIRKLIDDSYDNQKIIEKRQKREIKPKVLDESYEWGTLPPGAKNKPLAATFRKSVQIDQDASNGEYYSVVNMAEVRMEEGTEDQKYFDCNVCTKVFTKKNQLQRHLRTHSGVRPFTCKLCDKSFTRIDALKRHMASVGHRKQKELHPNVDDGLNIDYESLELRNEMDFTNNDSMYSESGEVLNQIETGQHDEMDHALDNDEAEETTCDAARFAQVTYANHDSIKIEPEDPLAQFNEENGANETKNRENYCHICQHTFTNKFNYDRHMKSHDKVNKSYKCTYCHYMFRRQSHLTRHTLIHTGEKPFQCNHCGERFSRSDKMKLHVARVHSHDTNDNEAIEIIKLRDVTPIVILKTDPDATDNGENQMN